MLRALLLALSLAVSLGPALAAAAPAKKGKVTVRKVTLDPLETWFESEDLLAQGDAGAALAKLKAGVEEIRRRPDDATIAGPGGAAWTKPEALVRYLLRAGDVASLLSWREAASLFQAAVEAAKGKELKSEAEIKLEAARAQIAAGNDRAPSFLGDDPERLVEDPSTAPLRLDGE